MSTLLEIENVTFSYEEKRIIDSISLSLKSGEVLVIMGVSGCGKTTLFRLIAGLERAESGTINYPTYDKKGRPPVFFNFQDYDALPWLTAEGNVRLMQRFSGGPPPIPSSREILASVGLSDKTHLYPRQLSGGMKKRLALARCIASRASVILLDEPFASLDIGSRAELQKLVLNILNERDAGIMIVTHDIDEAAYLGTRIVICSGPPLQFQNVISSNLEPSKSGGRRFSQEFEVLTAAIRREVMPGVTST